MMSMLAGIEVRVPLLDERLCNYLFSVKDRYKFNLFENKIVFRNYLKRKLPIYKNKNKVGFDFGDNEPSYIRLVEQMNEIIFLDKEHKIWSFLNFEETYKILQKPSDKYSKSSFYQLIVNIFVLHFWFQKIDIHRSNS